MVFLESFNSGGKALNVGWSSRLKKKRKKEKVSWAPACIPLCFSVIRYLITRSSWQAVNYSQTVIQNKVFIRWVLGGYYVTVMRRITSTILFPRIYLECSTRSQYGWQIARYFIHSQQQGPGPVLFPQLPTHPSPPGPIVVLLDTWTSTCLFISCTHSLAICCYAP